MAGVTYGVGTVVCAAVAVAARRGALRRLGGQPGAPPRRRSRHPRRGRRRRSSPSSSGGPTPARGRTPSPRSPSSSGPVTGSPGREPLPRPPDDGRRLAAHATRSRSTPTRSTRTCRGWRPSASPTPSAGPPELDRRPCDARGVHPRRRGDRPPRPRVATVGRRGRALQFLVVLPVGRAADGDRRRRHARSRPHAGGPRARGETTTGAGGPRARLRGDAEVHRLAGPRAPAARRPGPRTTVPAPLALRRRRSASSPSR